MNRRMKDYNNNDIYKRYIKEGTNNFNTKELLELTDILYHLNKYHELIDVAEYTISLIDMGIGNDLIDEELNEWFNNYIDDVEDIEEYNLEFPEDKAIDEKFEKEFDEEFEDTEDTDDDRNDDNISSVREYLLKLIIECCLFEKNYDKVYSLINTILDSTDIRSAMYSFIAFVFFPTVST